jgi:hypothetical protein
VDATRPAPPTTDRSACREGEKDAHRSPPTRKEHRHPRSASGRPRDSGTHDCLVDGDFVPAYHPTPRRSPISCCPAPKGSPRGNNRGASSQRHPRAIASWTSTSQGSGKQGLPAKSYCSVFVPACRVTTSVSGQHPNKRPSSLTPDRLRHRACWRLFQSSLGSSTEHTTGRKPRSDSC